MLTALEQAGRLRQEFGTSDPMSICEQMDITIFEEELPESVRGFSLNIKGKKLIYLNSQLPYGMQRQVCAHELGHIILHPKHNLIFMLEHTLYVHERFEKEADEFCAALLIPQEMLHEVQTIGELAMAAGVEERIADIRVRMERSLHGSCAGSECV